MGTWQFDRVDALTAMSLIGAAHDVGIRHFDTARVYAEGRAESLLAEGLRPDDSVITKIPAIKKDELSENRAYPKAHMQQIIEASIASLKRPPDVVLLHNWHAEWESGQSNLLQMLRSISNEYGIPKIGVSLPNDYDGCIEQSDSYDAVDCIEAPYNSDSPAITLERLVSWGLNRQIYIRSIFNHGQDTTNMAEKLREVLDTNCMPVVGATRPEQIYEWSEML